MPVAEHLPEPTDVADARRHRALASPVRVRLLELLQQRARGAAELAEQLELHVNTVRAHLKALQAAGLVRASPEQRDQPGRPRLAYEAVPAPGPGDDPGYRLLAQMLVGYLERELDAPERRAHELGAAWGRYLVDPPPPSTQLAAGEAVGQLTALLDRLGFAPSAQPEEDGRWCVRLRRCPYLELARDHAEVVCSTHLGLMRGALEGLGADVEVSDLMPFSEASACVGYLEPHR